jgi:gliding motility-associated-like protein
MYRKFLIILLFFIVPFLGKATHMVSGYLTFKWMSGTKYEVTFYNYANTCNDAIDQDTITIHWGDGTSTIVPRRNGRSNGGFPEGDSVCNCRKLCIYDTTHIFPGTNTYYRVYIDDAARMKSIANMYNSLNQDLYLFTTICFNPFGRSEVVAPVITNPLACQYACTGQCYYFNLGAYSPVGDSIVYRLSNCLAASGKVAAGYSIPAGVSIDPSSGTLSWCNPTIAGIYNFSIQVLTYARNIIGSGYSIEDTVETEVEIIVNSACTNSPPTITGIDDTCIVAGDILRLFYTARDAIATYPVKISATGDPFSTTPPATAPSPSPGNPVTLNFTWNTNCTEVKKTDYQVQVTATDIPPPGTDSSMSAYKTTYIYVLGPAPKHLMAKTLGNTVNLHWNPSICPQVKGYSIYRHTGCYKWIHGPCETGVPSYTGYIYIGSTVGLNDTTFLDNNHGVGLVPGTSYDYMVVANYPLPDGSISLASNDTCVKIKFDVPIITNVSVDSTSGFAGTIFVRWIKPVVANGDFDTILNPGPYKYVLFRAQGISGNSFVRIDSVISPFFNSSVATTFKDKGLNTYGTGYNYRMDFYCNNFTDYLGSSTNASSIYLTVRPDNNMLHLFWQSAVPWTDSSFMIYRTFPPPVTLIATVPGTQTTYTDSNLTNLKTFCYYIESKSAYSDTLLPHPLFDSSEVMCGVPKDTIPPCRPKLSVHAVCNEYKDSLFWTNPDYTCPAVKNRVLYYNVYFTPSPSSELTLIATIYNLKDTVFIHDSTSSIAGCFAVTAVDSFMNESSLDTICVDNCPDYVLPNIFTPNGDGINDLFTPILPYRFIKDIDIDILNRWGNRVFHTIDPMVRWDGKDENTHGNCPDGVYFYVCAVHEIHLDGIKTRTLKGFVQILR